MVWWWWWTYTQLCTPFPQIITININRMGEFMYLSNKVTNTTITTE